VATVRTEILKVAEMHVIAAIGESGSGDRDGLSIAHSAMARCAQLVSVAAVYRTMDRLEGRNLVTWRQAGEDDAMPGRGHRRYRVTIEGRKGFDQSLGFMPIKDRQMMAFAAKK
jgi:DNA-binding MarR family transcriptional regulator